MNLETDYLVIGSGAAGLSFALKAAEHSHVIVVTKGEMNECNTNYAQGGICCVTYEPDTFQKHIDDTMVCGGGICDMQAVELVVTRAPQLMKDLVQWGTRFDKTREGRYELAREGGHSEYRILHHKDETGAEIERTLISQVKSHRNIEVLEYHFAIDLLTQHHLGQLVTRHTEGIECYGAYVMDLKRGRIKTILSRVTVIATGGRPMVKSAYSSGTPAFGSGAGNATEVIDETANTPERIAEVAMNCRISKTSDFGSGCSCDGNIVCHASVYDDFVKALVKEGAYIANADEAEKLKLVMWDETGHRLPDTVAIAPQKLAEKAGFEIPADRKFIAVTGGGRENIGKEHLFSSEKLTTLMALFKYDGEFENALDMVRAIYEVGGKGHSCGIYSFDDDHIHRLAMMAPVSRIMVRQPNNKGNAGSATNGMPPTSSMGCGTWGGNIVSENIALKHYMNTTWVARPIPEDMPSLQELFGDFYKDGMDVE